MAIIKFINNKVGLKKTLNYVCKEEKTNNKFISGKDCMAENAYEEMMAIKNMYAKTEGREKLHFVQAFSPNDELSYETLLKIIKNEKVKVEKFTGKIEKRAMKIYKDIFKNDKEFSDLIIKLLDEYFSSEAIS